MKIYGITFVVVALVFTIAPAPTVSAALTDGLVAWWQFNGSAADSSGNGHNGSIYGSGITSVEDRFGVSNGAYHFSNQSYITVPDSPSLTLGSNPFTLALWVRLDTIQNFYLMGHDEGGGNTNKWIFWLDAANHSLALHTNNPSTGGAFPVNTTAWTPQINEWYHLAVTRSGNTWTLFANGSQIGQPMTSAVTVPDPNHALWIGNAEPENSRGLVGSLDDVRIYNRALSGQEIGQLSSVPVPAPLLLLGSGLVGLLALKRKLGR